jgi:hypothetical protein
LRGFTLPYDDAKAGAAVAVQSFGDFQNFNSHLHVICTDGCFYGNDSLKTCPTPDPKDMIDSDISRQAFRKNWARLIQKI